MTVERKIRRIRRASEGGVTLRFRRDDEANLGPTQFTVAARIYGPWALHRSVDRNGSYRDSGYRISHRVTGCAAVCTSSGGGRFSLPEGASLARWDAVARAMERIPADFTDPLDPAVQGIADAVAEAVQARP